MAFRYLHLLLFWTFSSVGFSQALSEAAADLAAGKALANANPHKAFALLERAMNKASQLREDGVYLESLSELRKLSGNVPGKKLVVFRWHKTAAVQFEDARTLSVSEFFCNTANLYLDLSPQTDSALYFFRKALAIRTTLPTTSPELIAECYQGIADVYKYFTYQFNEAEQNYEKALTLRLKMKDANVYSVATNYFSLAATNRSQRDFERALLYAEAVPPLCIKMNDFEFLEQAYGMVANVYRDMYKSDQARMYYQKAIALNARYSKSLTLLTWSYVGLGQTYKNDKAWDLAILNFKKALSQFEQLHRSNSLYENTRKLWVHCQFHLAETYRLAMRVPESRAMLRQLYGTLKWMKMDNGRELVEYFNEVGNVHRENKVYDSALYYYNLSMRTALPDFKSCNVDSNPTDAAIGIQYFVHTSLGLKAAVYRKKFQVSKDPRFLRLETACLRLSEKLLAAESKSLDAEESRLTFLDENYNVYEKLLDNLLLSETVSPGDSSQRLMFRYMEKSKARFLSEAIAKAEATEYLTDSLILSLTANRYAWRKVENLLQDEGRKANPTDSVVNSLRQQQVDIDREHQNLRESIEHKFPGYSSVKFANNTVTAANLQHYLGEQNRIVIEYFYGLESVYGFAISKDRMMCKRLGSADSLATPIRNFLQHFYGDHSRLDKQVFANFVRNSAELYDELVRPFYDLVHHASGIYVVPDGLISQLPFELLLTEQFPTTAINYKSLPYAIRQSSFGYAYSASLLLHRHNAAVQNPTILAMGYTGGKRLRSPTEELVEIEGAELELEALQKQFHSGKFMVGQDVTESNFKKLAPYYDIIHLAIHGRGDIQEQFSSTLFFRTASDSLNDGKLHAYELYSLKFNASLAVLTACESGLGEAHRGEGMMSIATAFTYSGCQNTLMSLWKVDDQASVGLMNDFYQQLLDGKSIDRALTTAKLNYLNEADEYSADPAIWAPMIVYGNSNPVVAKRSSLIWIVVGAILLLLLLVAVRKK